MRQRSAPSRRRFRVLIEHPSKAYGVADFRLFQNEGFDVATCTGPDESAPCPLATTGRCSLVSEADVVLFELDPNETQARRVLDAYRTHAPDTPVVVHAPGFDEDDPSSHEFQHLHFPASVRGQLDALRAAILRTAWG